MYYNVCDEAWLSLVERCVRDAEVAGSNPVASTKTSEMRVSGVFFVFTDTGKCYDERKSSKKGWESYDKYTFGGR